jgi:protocatechuate 3,4-dioxygenase alpha subunit
VSTPMTLPAQTSDHPEPDGPTPSQTIGPFFRPGMTWMNARDLTAPGSGAVVLTGRVTDGAGDPVPDAMIEIWQADATGSFDTRPQAWSGFGRALTDADGRYRFTTVLPGPVDDHQAPHVDMSVFARGLLQRLVTRVYFHQDALDTDPVLAALDPRRRATLTARREESEDGEDPVFRFDIRLQGGHETVFFTW